MLLLERSEGTDPVPIAMKKNTRMLLLLLLLPAAVFGALLVSAMQNSAAYYYTITELQAQERPDRALRIKGALAADSVRFDAEGPTIHFQLQEQPYSLDCVAHQPMPDNFLHSDEVIVEGRFDDDGVFQASKLMLQCPSKYEPESNDP